MASGSNVNLLSVPLQPLMTDEHVVVVGAGMAGLVSALLLSDAGFKVTVIEAAETPGGKIRQLHVQGAAIDSGPTVFTMRHIFEDIYARVGLNLSAELELHRLDVIARHAWEDGSKLDLFADHERTVHAVSEFAGAAEAQRYERFAVLIRELFDTLEHTYMGSAQPSTFNLTRSLGFKGVGVLRKIGLFKSLWDSLGKQFADPKLRQLFARYATYCGSSPWEAPATLMLIAQVEMDGVWSVKGGMHAIARNLMGHALAKGVEFCFNTRCERIEVQGGKVVAVHVRSTSEQSSDTSRRLATDRVVFNGDAAALRQGLLGTEAIAAVSAQAPERSLSAITWSSFIPTEGFELDRHNVFFQQSQQYSSEFGDIFKAHQLPSKPTVYICAQDRGAHSVPQGPERLLCLVNAPAVGDTPTLSQEAIQACQQQSLSLLQRCGLKLQFSPQDTVCTTPAQFHQLFPATGGALYGQATHSWMAAFARPLARSALQGLYLAGGSIHPGPGVPMAALSGRMAAEALVADRNSTKRFHPAVTYGGTSTP